MNKYIEFLAQRNKSGFELGPDEHVKLVDRRVSFGHETVDALADINRLIRFTEDALADAGKDTVGADHEIIMAATAVGETYRDGGIVLINGLDGEAISNRGSLGLSGLGHEVGKQKAFCSDRSRQTRTGRWQRVLGLEFAGTVANQEEVEAESLLGGAVGESHHIQRAQCGPRQGDADAENSRFEFDNVDGNPTLSQRNRHSQPADPGADY